MTAADTMKDQRSLYLCKSLCCLTLVLNCAQMIKLIFLSTRIMRFFIFLFFFRNNMFGKGQIRDTCLFFKNRKAQRIVSYTLAFPRFYNKHNRIQGTFNEKDIWQIETSMLSSQVLNRFFKITIMIIISVANIG